MLGWSRQDLARAAKVAVGTIVDFERKARRPYDRTLLDIKRALENAGIEFIEENGGGLGVRFKDRMAD
jgi:transcriptional regulator with XRE-family HTH domain